MRDGRANARDKTEILVAVSAAVAGLVVGFMVIDFGLILGPLAAFALYRAVRSDRDFSRATRFGLFATAALGAVWGSLWLASFFVYSNLESIWPGIVLLGVAVTQFELVRRSGGQSDHALTAPAFLIGGFVCFTWEVTAMLLALAAGR